MAAVFLYRQSRKTIMRSASTKTTLPDTEEEQTLQKETSPDEEKTKTNTEQESIEEQNFTIEPSWDKIVLEFKDPSFSYKPPNKIGDYNVQGAPDIKYPPENKRYLPYRTTRRYENRVGNKMEIINTERRYKGVDTSTFKIQVHSETRLIQLNEVEEIANIISTHYKERIKSEIQLYPSVVELALDHFTPYPYFYYNLNQGHLFKRHYKSRIDPPVAKK